MFDTIKIGDKAVPMLCLASTNIYYKKVFGVDPIELQTRDDLSTADGINFAQGLAFIMAKQAETNSNRTEMLKLNEDSFIDWLDGFDGVDLQMALEGVMMIYRKDLRTTAKEKKAP